MLYVGRGDGLSVVKGATIEVMIMLCIMLPPTVELHS